MVKKKKKHIKNQILDICNKPLYEAIKHFRCGFELETQKFMGKTTQEYPDNRCQPEYDVEAYENHIKQKVDSVMDADFAPFAEWYITVLHDGSNFGNHYRAIALTDVMYAQGALWRLVMRNVSKTQLLNCIAHLKPRMFPRIKASDATEEVLLSRFKTAGLKLRDIVNYDNENGDNQIGMRFHRSFGRWGYSGCPSAHEPFFTVREGQFPYNPATPVRTFRQISDWVEYLAGENWDEKLIGGTDGSVTGPEIRTSGALTVTEFMKAANSVFKNDMKVDDKCSFHIHISVNGIEHKFSRQFQSALYEGLLRQYAYLPESVKKRLSNSSQRNQYFSFQGLGDSRYNGIAYRNSWNTWEFRLFGNITNARDAARCLMIAVRAMKFAYRSILLRKEENVLTPSRFDKKNQAIARFLNYPNKRGLYASLLDDNDIRSENSELYEIREEPPQQEHWNRVVDNANARLESNGRITISHIPVSAANDFAVYTEDLNNDVMHRAVDELRQSIEASMFNPIRDDGNGLLGDERYRSYSVSSRYID